MGDRSRGLHEGGKFHVKRIDGSDEPGGKHDGCWYFVLDVTHDPHAIPALREYAKRCESDGYGLLAADLRTKLRDVLRDELNGGRLILPANPTEPE